MSHLESQLAAVRLAWSLDPAAPRELTGDETATLTSFMGWGQFAKVFRADDDTPEAAIAAELEDILPADAYFEASMQVDTSFFTPAAVTGAVYDILRSVGFTGGRAFEPGCGAGAFMSAAPADMNIAWTGVDIDPTAARIAKLLHPTAEIITGRLEKTEVRDGTYDIAVGNVPFSATRIHDAAGRYAALHNYFLQRAALTVRPGGYVVAVTSRHTLDASGGLLAPQNASDFAGMTFEGAVRLPSDAFGEAGTSVVTDIIVLRRPDVSYEPVFYSGTPEQDYARDPWGYARATDNGLFIEEPAQAAPGVRTRVSAFWADNLDLVAGTMKVTTYDRSPLVVRSEDPAGDISAAVSALTARLTPMTEPGHALSLDDVILEDEEGRKEGSFHVIDGKMHKVERGALVAARTSKELVHLVRLRDMMTELLALESNLDLPDEEMAEHRAATRAAYEQYLTAFGPLNRGTLVEGKPDEDGNVTLSWRRPPLGGFRRDPDSALVMALEVFDQSTGAARAADILTRRVNRAPEPIERVDTPAEAIAVSMGESGRIDLHRIASLLDLDDAQVAADTLGDLIWEDPATGRIIPAAEYLSGDVREKLRLAEDRGLTAHAEALRAVLPADLGPLDITLSLGHPLVAAGDVVDFIEHGLGAGHVKISHEPYLGVWEVDGGDYANQEAKMTWGTPDITPARLVEHALNNKTPEITDRVYDPRVGDYRQVRNADKTATAMMKLEEINDRFSTWVWEDQARSERICREYNDRFNAHVTRTYTGEGMTFPGMADTFTPWAHQCAGVERIVSNATSLIGHPVGAGKSATMALAAVVLRGRGLANKPLIIVPNHLLEQMAREVQQVIPTAKILVATKEDLQKDNRRVFAARCATGDWDAVIMTHSAFTMIPVSPQVEQRWIAEQKYELHDALAEHAEGGSKGAKAIARRIRSFEQQMDKARTGMGDTDAIYFDQLGIDFIAVDEMHLFRRLPTHSTQRGSGLGSGSSKRSTDLLLKIETLREKKGWDAPVIAGFTGTPWSNTLAETWVWQRYLQPELLTKMGLRPFDAWAGAFVRYETANEVAPDGSGFRSYRRPVGLVNVAEVKTMLAQVADLISADDLQTERPDAFYETFVVDGTPEQMSYVAGLAERSENLRNKVDTGIENDNMLLIVGDGRKVALDPQLVGLDEFSAKVTAFADRAAATYHEDKDRTFGDLARPGGFQLVFCDLGTPHPSDPQTYGRIRKALIDRGVPATRIRFIHEATTDKGRAALFASCRDGDVSFLIGSTPKVGMGTNVQTRLTDVWHLDAPWLPSEMIQRDGRGIRHGNLSGTVRIRRVVVEGTFDAYMWQTLERKSRSFDALYAAGASARELEDVSSATLSYGEVKALAAGNPLLLEQANARTEVKKLRLLRAVHLQGVNAARDQAKRATENAARNRRQAASLLDVHELLEERGMPEIDVVALARQIREWQGGENTWSRFAMGAFNIGANVSRDYRQNTSRLTSLSLRVDYDTVHEWFIDKNFARKSPRTIAKWLVAAVTKSIGDAQVDAGILMARADREDEYAAEATALVERSSFDREAELQAAVTRLAEIDAAIDEQVIADQRQPVSA
ncbi:helicase-related protein [Microbacterium sp. 77mftsu3.1]|uniref:helicase-related protein n=1 Tax=Microbacterium sp. 77mftsu3.1 TaxID=1761802 RepID=UPI000378E886|nr:helicase-related protein [Microbacterium sp. 77mftsu3.1]SDH55258.1 Adenine-specific DNA methylase, N12 class [Microbacterium sp. 77mftsu3.1]